VARLKAFDTARLNVQMTLTTEQCADTRAMLVTSWLDQVYEAALMTKYGRVNAQPADEFDVDLSSCPPTVKFPAQVVTSMTQFALLVVSSGMNWLVLK